MSRLIELADAYAMVVYQTKNPDSEEADAGRAALVAEIERVERDAARYQAIREGLEVYPDNSGIVISLIDDFGVETLRGQQADVAIDASMKEQIL